MNEPVSLHLVKAIAGIAIFLEFTDDELLDADTSVEAMEQLAMELQLMDDESRRSLARQLKTLSARYAEARTAQFVKKLPESLGLE